jgi:hypothetical protein
MSISLFANNIQTTLATSITSSQTSVTLVSAAGLPSPTSGQYFVMTFTNGATNEVVWVTNVTGSVITCIRAREGTSASSFASGSFASCFPTAGTMQNIVQIDQLQNGAYTFANGAGTANALTATIASNLTVVPNGFQFVINAANANTGAATLNLTLNPTIAGASPISTGALPIYQNGNFPLTGGEITGTNYLCLISYNSNYNGGLGAFVLENPYNPVVGVVGITQVQDQYFTYNTSGGSADALTLTVPAGLGALTDGAVVVFRNTVSSNATTTPTLNVTYGSTSTGATVIKKYNNQSLSAGDTGGVGYVCQLVYSSSASAWMLLNPAPGVAGGVTSITAGTGITASSPSGAVTLTNSGVITVNGSAGTVTVTPTSIGALSLNSTGDQTVNTGSGHVIFTNYIEPNAVIIGGSGVVYPGVQVYSSGVGGGFVGVLTPTSIQFATIDGGTAIQTASGANLYAKVANQICWIADSLGSLTIANNLTASSNLYVTYGTGYKPGGGSWSVPVSDERLKENITPLSGALNFITKLNPVTFDLKIPTENEPTVGFIAQEVQKILPLCVTSREPTKEETKYVSDKVLTYGFHGDMTAYLVGAIKELNLKQVELETKINIQAAYIAALQAKV